ncbi:zinc-binding alcohol dehydrogenase family protein [Pseudomonadota bacterium]
MMKAIRVNEKCQGPDLGAVEFVELPRPTLEKEQCLIEVLGSCVNPSDAKGLLGKMPYLVWPRTPGRDYAGRVVDGPENLVGKEVWGGGSGVLGMSANGAHAEFLVTDAASVSEKPERLTMLEAGAIGVPFTCAYMGLVDGADAKAGDTVLVMGANGKVGQAVIQLATMLKTRVIGVERNGDQYLGHATGPVEIINASQRDVLEAVMEKTNGLGADIVYNTVGSPYFAVANDALAKQGRQIIIATIDQEMPLNLFKFYRGNHRLIGVSNMDLDTVGAGQIYRKLKPGFDSGALQPYPVDDASVYELGRAVEAYRAVLTGATKNRVIIKP